MSRNRSVQDIFRILNDTPQTDEAKTFLFALQYFAKPKKIVRYAINNSKDSKHSELLRALIEQYPYHLEDAQTRLLVCTALGVETESESFSRHTFNEKYLEAVRRLQSSSSSSTNSSGKKTWSQKRRGSFSGQQLLDACNGDVRLCTRSIEAGFVMPSGGSGSAEHFSGALRYRITSRGLTARGASAPIAAVFNQFYAGMGDRTWKPLNVEQFWMAVSVTRRTVIDWLRRNTTAATKEAATVVLEAIIDEGLMAAPPGSGPPSSAAAEGTLFVTPYGHSVAGDSRSQMLEMEKLQKALAEKHAVALVLSDIRKTGAKQTTIRGEAGAALAESIRQMLDAVEEVDEDVGSLGLDLTEVEGLGAPETPTDHTPPQKGSKKFLSFLKKPATPKGSPRTSPRPSGRSSGRSSPRTPRTPTSARKRRTSLGSGRDSSELSHINIDLERLRSSLTDSGNFDMKNFGCVENLNFTLINPMDIAQQVTLMMREIYGRICPRHLMMQDWMRDDTLHLHPVNALRSFANDLSMWAASEILMWFPVERARHRGDVLSMLIRLVQCFVQLHNYCAAIPLILGLQMGAVDRLQEVDHLKSSDMNELQELKELADPSKSYANYRAQIAKLGSSEASCIPHIGVVLADLVYMEDGNPTMVGDLVNFEKLDMIKRRIEKTLRFQKSRCALRVIDEIQQFWKTGRVVLNDEDLFRVSYRIKPRRHHAK